MTTNSLVYLYGDSKLPKKFWAKVRVDKATGCWTWLGKINSYGYGKISKKKEDTRNSRVEVYAHREAYKALVGYLPSMLDHVCKNTLCCNPSHLRACTHRTNNQYRLPGGKYLGVSKVSRGNLWRVRARIGPLQKDGRRLSVQIATFKSDEAAARLYDVVALEAYGEFASLNFPESVM